MGTNVCPFLWPESTVFIDLRMPDRESKQCIHAAIHHVRAEVAVSVRWHAAAAAVTQGVNGACVRMDA